LPIIDSTTESKKFLSVPTTEVSAIGAEVFKGSGGGESGFLELTPKDDPGGGSLGRGGGGGGILFGGIEGDDAGVGSPAGSPRGEAGGGVGACFNLPGT